MMNVEEIKAALPPRIKMLGQTYDLWLTGSALSSPHPNDYDLVSATYNWSLVSQCIPQAAIPNKFGGWRWSESVGAEKLKIDLWPMEFDRLMGDMFYFRGLYSIRRGILWTKV